MGFYGNIQNSNKTAFTFDLIYHSRLTMVNHANDDGVFLGRYVLVDYDETAVLAYYNSADKWFYNDKNLMLPHKILNPKFNIIYEVANEDYPVDQPRFFYYRPKGFYEENSPAQFEPISIKITDGTGDSIDAVSISPYAVSHTLDVREFGRGYDSTVWQKVYDNGKYKYVLVAELNAKVPNFRLIADHPTETPVSPYFDRDSTTMDYYLHQSPAFGNRVKAVPDGEKNRSDEEMVRNEITYVYTDEKNPTWSEEPVKRNADIYYNKAGFDKDFRTYITNEDARSKNTINYDRVESGRHYGYQDGPIYKAGEAYPDTYEWYFRLPVLGNTISSLWDAMYGYSGDENEVGGIAEGKRYLEFSQREGDTANHRVSYNKNTLIGLMNNVRDLMGYEFLPTSILDNYKTGDDPKVFVDEQTGKVFLKEASTIIKVDHTYATAEISEEDKTATEHNIINVLYYTLGKNQAVDNYYYFAYDPDFAEVNEEQGFEEGIQYYYKDTTDEYKLANVSLYKAEDANGNLLPFAPYDNYYTKVDKWTLTALPIKEDTLHGLVLKLHSLIGTGDNDTRDINTINGAINIIKDIVANIDQKLEPGKIVRTNKDTGIIETSETYFPSADWDKDEVLDGEGHWVSRFAQVTILPQSTNANQDAPEVNDISNGKENSKSIILESDNDKEGQGHRAVRRNKHSANNLTFGTRNKWIELHPNAEKDSVEFKHANSPIVTRLRAEQADGTGYTDMFEAVGENDNVTLNDKTTFKNFSANTALTEITVEPTTDKLQYNSTKPDQNDNRLTIPSITVDNAGHVVEMKVKNFNIPHTFKKVQTTTIADINESASLDQAGISIAESITDTLNIAPRNRWIDIATENTNDEEGAAEDKITFSHRLVPTLNTSVTLNGQRRTSADVIPTVYRYGLPQDKSVTDFDAAYNGGSGTAYEAENTFNVPYIEVDKAGHVVAAETHIVTLPENFSAITVEPQNESTSNEADTITDEKATLTADTLTDELVLKTVNRWIGVGLTDNQDNDILTFGHRLSDIRNVTPLNLNGSRRANSKYTNVYRYGLPQDKTIADLDKENNGGSGTAYEAANTFNVPYMEIDEAGHIVHAETHTVTLPENFTTITIAEASNSPGIKAIAETEEEAGDIADSLAGSGTLQADTLTDDIKISASNKWIRLKGADAASDEITIGHEIHKIFTSTPVEDMDVTKKDQFSTQILTWDNAGHIVTNETKTWTLPNSIHDLEVTGTSTDSDNPAGTDGTIVAGTTFDTVKLNASNKWVRLTADPTNNTITFGHLVQDIETGKRTTDLNSFGTFDTEEYTYDEAGHIRSKHIRTLKLPFNYKTIKVAQSKNEDSITTNTGSIVAETQVDSYTLAAGNKWIELAASDSKTDDVITIAHSLQGTAGIYNNGEYTFNKTENDTVQTGVFGGTVTLYGYKTDNAGHIIANQTYSLKLPEGSYSESGGDAGANVLTKLEFTPSEGKLIGTKVNIGTLKITGYSTDDMTAQTIGADNTLNQALAYLQLEINEEASTRSSEDEKLQDAIDKEIEDRTDAINTVNGKITTLSGNVYTKTEVDEAIYTKAQVDQAIKDAISAFATANGLTVPTT